jgi:uncharacterized protein YegL
VNSVAYLAQLFGFNHVATANSGIGGLNIVEIMLTLDRSGSMQGTPENNLKDAVLNAFIPAFESSQDLDKVGLVSFATTATVDVPLETNYVSDINSAVNAMNAANYTNSEDAIAQSGAQLPDYSSVSQDKRVKQFLIFFSDGMPTALRYTFKYNNNSNNNNQNYDGIVHEGNGNNCQSTTGSVSVDIQLYKPTGSGQNSYSGVNPSITGDGKGTSTTSCCTSYNKNGTCKNNSGYLNTKWYLFETASPGPESG